MSIDIKQIGLDVGKIVKNIVCVMVALACLVALWFTLFDGFKSIKDPSKVALGVEVGLLIVACVAFNYQFAKFVAIGSAGIIGDVVGSIRTVRTIPASPGMVEVTTTTTASAVVPDPRQTPRETVAFVPGVVATPAPTKPPGSVQRNMLKAAAASGMLKAVPDPRAQVDGE